MQEGNTLAILDSSSIREACDVHDDRLSFLEAVRDTALTSISPSPPTGKLFDEILHILRYGKSLELSIASFQLLSNLDKRYPRVYLKEHANLGNDSSVSMKLVVNKEAWSPFAFGSGTSFCEDNALCTESKNLIDSLSFTNIMEEIANSRHQTSKMVQNMLLFQYLVHILEADFLPRYISCKATFNWGFLRESLLSMLLVSRKMNYKSLVHNCMSMVSTTFLDEKNFCLKDLKDAQCISADLPKSCNVGLSFAFHEIKQRTCKAAQKLLMLIMKLDVMRKEAETIGLTSRSDGFRALILDTIINELAYNTDQLSQFLEVFADPKWKLEIILLYFGKYLSRPSTRSRSSNNSANGETFEGILNWLLNPTTGSISRNVPPEVACLLLAQGFKCCLSLQHDQKDSIFVTKKIGGSTQSEICNSFITAIEKLKKLNGTLELTSFQKQALITAATLA